MFHPEGVLSRGSHLGGFCAGSPIWGMGSFQGVSSGGCRPVGAFLGCHQGGVHEDGSVKGGCHEGIPPGQQAGGTHPTLMFSCFAICFQQLFF